VSRVITWLVVDVAVGSWASFCCHLLHHVVCILHLSSQSLRDPLRALKVSWLLLNFISRAAIEVKSLRHDRTFSSRHLLLHHCLPLSRRVGALLEVVMNFLIRFFNLLAQQLFDFVLVVFAIFNALWRSKWVLESFSIFVVSVIDGTNARDIRWSHCCGLVGRELSRLGACALAGTFNGRWRSQLSLLLFNLVLRPTSL
jgi:hypothetical protein